MTQPNLDIAKLKELTKILPTPPLLTSAEANWNHTFLAYFQHPGSEIDKHTIPFHCLEVMDVCSQSPHWRQIGEEYSSHEIHGGEIFLCPAHTEHKIDWTQTLHFSLLVFAPRFFEQMAEGLEIFKPIELLPQLQASDPWIQKAANALKADLEVGCPVGSLYGQALGKNLAKYVLENFSTSKPKICQCISGLSEIQLKRVQERIYEHISDEEKIGEDISEIELAQVAGVNPIAFCRLISQSTGMSLFKYIIMQRLEYAKQLLKCSDYTITEVALKCGYNDPNYFTRQFRKKFDITPSEFRQQRQNVLVDFGKCARQSQSNLDTVLIVQT